MLSGKEDKLLKLFIFLLISTLWRIDKHQLLLKLKYVYSTMLCSFKNCRNEVFWTLNAVVNNEYFVMTVFHVSYWQVPVFRPMDLMVEASPRRIFANAHTYHINSISINSDYETYLSADDLRINLWHLEITDRSFSIHLFLFVLVLFWWYEVNRNISPNSHYIVYITALKIFCAYTSMWYINIYTWHTHIRCIHINIEMYINIVFLSIYF